MTSPSGRIPATGIMFYGLSPPSGPERFWMRRKHIRCFGGSWHLGSVGCCRRAPSCPGPDARATSPRGRPRSRRGWYRGRRARDDCRGCRLRRYAAVRSKAPAARSLRPPAADRRDVRLDPHLVDEDKALGIETRHGTAPALGSRPARLALGESGRDATAQIGRTRLRRVCWAPPTRHLRSDISRFGQPGSA